MLCNANPLLGRPNKDPTFVAPLLRAATFPLAHVLALVCAHPPGGYPVAFDPICPVSSSPRIASLSIVAPNHLSSTAQPHAVA